MNHLFLFLLLILQVTISIAQSKQDTLSEKESTVATDDPSQFFTRMELFNEIQHHQHNGSDFYLNQTTWRTIVKLGKRFTTRLDVPFVYNSLVSSGDNQQFGLSDISFRLLGYKFFQSKKAAVTASIEISLNTAQSPLLGLGKNIILPVVTYTSVVNKKGALLAFLFQQANSFSGDEARETISYSKLQVIFLCPLSRRVWTVVAPEMYIDYVHGGASMNLEGRIAYAPTKRINVWAQAGAGLYGEFAARYQWGAEAGCRYFFLRNTIIKRTKSE